MPSFTLPPNLERALRKEKDELEFHIEKYSTCLAKIDESSEVREEARSEELIKAFTKLAIKFSRTEKYVILNSSLIPTLVIDQLTKPLPLLCNLHGNHLAFFQIPKSSFVKRSNEHLAG